jgi:NlpC/P60 family putative phage cell wall peptidase
MTIKRSEVTRLARSWVGTPYHHRASVRQVGCDCIGLVRGLWRELYGSEPESPGPYTGDWAEATGNEALLAAAGRHLRRSSTAAMRPGDVLIFRVSAYAVAKHAAILVEDERMIHATEGVPVSEVSLSRWWRRRICGVFVLPGLAEDVCADNHATT